MQYDFAGIETDGCLWVLGGSRGLLIVCEGDFYGCSGRGQIDFKKTASLWKF